MLASILKTICYADMFDYSLTLDQIYQFLISDKAYSLSEVERGVNHLVKVGKLSSKKEKRSNYIKMYTLSGREPIVLKTLRNKEFSRAKVIKAHNVIGWLRSIPSVQAVFVTGSLAMDNAKETDDIDLMVICKSGTLWRTRMWVTLILENLSVRRKPETGKKVNLVADKICPNLYLSDSNLAIPSDKQNLYIAHEVVQSRVILDKANIHKKLLEQNKWVRLYLPHSPTSPTHSLNHLVNREMDQNTNNGLLEKIAYTMQKLYMKPRLTRELVSLNAAFFHPRDTEREIMNAYNNRLSKYLI